jgi:hypothetical protein
VSVIISKFIKQLKISKMKKIILLMAGIVMLAYSCKTKDNPIPEDIGGLGGNFTLVTFPKHHDKATMRTARVFIKYNTNAFPGTDTTKYDNVLTAIREPGMDPHAHFKYLKAGKYFLYGVAMDTTINQVVTGGIPVVISSSSQPEIDITVPVTE